MKQNYFFKMNKLLVTLLFCIISQGILKLLVNNEAELFDDNGDYDFERIFGEADLINSTNYQSETCPEIEEQQRFYEYFIKTEAGEEKDVIEAVIPIDLKIKSLEMHNIEEPWIIGSVWLRYVSLIFVNIRSHSNNFPMKVYYS